MAACEGNRADHCCYVAGVACQFLRDDGSAAQRRWICTLREKLGSWGAVHIDPGYVTAVRPMWERINPALNCGDWPPPDMTCQACGVTG
jgi:hypothetical protein